MTKAMKTRLTLTLAALGLATYLQPASAQLAIPSDGSDGALAPDGSVTNVVIDLSQAMTGSWDANNSSNAGKGIYDPNKWAVVFKYSSVNIPAGVMVSFKNHPTHGPVVWLVLGDVRIDGTVDLSGASGHLLGPASLAPPEPGPGGFRGGPLGPQGFGSGLGPGGGGAGSVPGIQGTFVTSYGNPQLVPLIGGSGGSAGNYSGPSSGGAGGGALLIAAARTRWRRWTAPPKGLIHPGAATIFGL
jgi:hypothetical protein